MKTTATESADDHVVRVQEFTDADWPSVWTIIQEVVSTGETYSYDPGWTPAQVRAVWIEPLPWHTVVAMFRSRVVGIAKMGPNRPGRGSHVATASFMVAGDARGLGVGTTLGNYVVAWAKAQGYAAIQFNAVVESNKAAVHLWTKLGFRIIGTVPEAFEHPTLGRVGLHIMYLRLGPSAPRPAVVTTGRMCRAS